MTIFSGPDKVLEDAYARAAARDALSPLLPFLDEELGKMEQGLLNAAFSKIARGELKPEEALSTLMYLKAARDMGRRVRQRVDVEPEELRNG